MAGGLGAVVTEGGRLGGAEDPGSGKIGAGNLDVSTALMSAGDGGGGNLAGARIGAEVAIGKGTEGVGAGATSSGCVTAACAP